MTSIEGCDRYTTVMNDVILSQIVGDEAALFGDFFVVSVNYFNNNHPDVNDANCCETIQDIDIH